ncbi:LacI family DNA-binding transcriptional regulator [Microbacterium sp. BK668]|uniref:LacI family DNA-binding transcriptional regulator n=1 Tax=Microbacterium sp. BK668 TaxID=2512118 RepID=UPI00106239D0|nr:LacI family DNA-binding transcriptional regulator [Microbacterium sp. BK668]TDN90812.1 LacI family transcriptional regulator [Microbacterium sp. BK668]
MAGVTLQDVADHAGVSMKTVSNVVRNYAHVSEKTRAAVQSAIDELGYRPNVMGRRLATGRSGLIALAFADVGVPYFAELARMSSRTTQRFGYRLLLEETDGTLEGEREVVASSEAGLVDGFLFQPSVMSSTEVARHRGDVPIVLLGEAAAPLTMDRIMVDNVAAAAEATAHLLALGRRRVGFVGHEATGLTNTSRLRIAGYQQAIEEAGLVPEPGLLIPAAEVSAQASARSVGAALDAGLQVDALFCRDDLAAIGALRAVQERGRRVPDDIAIIGWDNIGITEVTYPSITTVAPDMPALVERALEMLVERIEGFDGMGRHELAPHRIVFRESAPEN